MLNPNSLLFIQQIESQLAKNYQSEAQALFNQYQRVNPDAIETLYIKGLIALINDQPQEAIESFKRVKSNFQHDAKFHNNLGLAHFKLQQNEAAHLAFETAHQIEPQNTQAQYNLVCSCIRSEDGHTALEHLNQLLDEDHNNSQYLCAKADALRINQAYKEAVQFYQRCLSVDPNHMSANSNLGALLIYFGQHELALNHALKAVELGPNEVLVHLNLGRCLSRLERFDEAMEAFADAYDLNQQSPQLCAEIADMWSLSGDPQEANSWYQKALRLQPDFTPAIAGLARLMLLTDQAHTAIELLEQQLSLNEDDYLINQVYADALWDEGDVPAALAVMKKITPNQQQNPRALAKSAQMLASSGEMATAMEYYQQALELNPYCVPALNGMAVKQRGKFNHELAERMNRMLKEDRYKERTQSLLHNGLAYYFDGNKAYEQATFHMSEGNRLQWAALSQQNWDYDQQNHHAHFEKIKQTFSANYFKQLKTPGCDSEQPVFIVAMPRSGTTLTEQILARHSQVLGIGERNFASQFLSLLPNINKSKQSALSCVPNVSDRKLQKIATRYLSKLNALKSREGKPEAMRVVDKMPDNYALIGWILTLFPKAKIIHCRRDPRDVALSCWMTQFGKIQWASRMDDLIDRIDQYQKMMAHWRTVIPGRFIEIDYEDLVVNQQQVSKRLINYLGLDWQPACLKFYQSDRVVRTASITQVRQPIYTKSVNKWQKYAPYIPELNDIKLS